MGCSIGNFQLLPQTDKIGWAYMKGSAQSETDAVADLARFCEGRLTAHGLHILARVRESERAFDLALGLSGRAGSVVRCVVRADPSDHHALKAMVAEGDFHHAALVYTSDDQPHLSPDIESYPLSRIDELAACLAKKSGQ